MSLVFLPMKLHYSQTARGHHLCDTYFLSIKHNLKNQLRYSAKNTVAKCDGINKFDLEFES